MQKVYSQYKNRGGTVIGIALDGDDTASLKQFRTRNKVTYPIAIDKGGRIFGQFKMGIPSAVLLDRRGTIRLIEGGFSTAKFAAAKRRFASLLPRTRAR